MTARQVDWVFQTENGAGKVASVELNLAAKSVTIAVEYGSCGGVCPAFKAECGLKDHVPEATWRYLNTMQFEKVLNARFPRINCPKCGVKTIFVPRGE